MLIQENIIFLLEVQVKSVNHLLEDLYNYTHPAKLLSLYECQVFRHLLMISTLEVWGSSQLPPVDLRRINED